MTSTTIRNRLTTYFAGVWFTVSPKLLRSNSRTSSSVWEALLGPQRIPVDLARNQPWIQPALYDEIQQRLEQATSDVPVAKGNAHARSNDFQDVFGKLVQDLHPVLATYGGNVRGNIRHRKNRIEFDFEFRYPAVRVKLANRPEEEELFLADRYSVRVLPEWYRDIELDEFPIVDVGGREPIAAGERWEQPDFSAAVNIAQRIRNFVAKSSITTVRNHPKNAGQFQLVNSAGQWVFDWGHAISQEPIGEPDYKQKVKALATYLGQLYRLKTSASEPVRVDLAKMALTPN